MADTRDTAPHRWCVAILSARETVATLESTFDAVVAAAGSADTAIDVVVNGNRVLAHAVAARLRSRPFEKGANVRVRVWNLALRDKAHAWTTYVHRLWPGGTSTFFVDGCISVAADAFSALHAGLDTPTHALAAAAVPTSGRSARAIRELMLRHPQIHGSLYALSREAVERVRTSQLELPRGFYRSDALLGTLFNFNLDPATHEWDDSRITVVPTATWTMPEKSPWKPADVAAHMRRLARQALGRIEEAAIKGRFFDERASTRTLVTEPLAFLDEWMRHQDGMTDPAWRGTWLARRRMAQLRRRSDWALAEHQPECLLQR